MILFLLFHTKPNVRYNTLKLAAKKYTNDRSAVTLGIGQRTDIIVEGLHHGNGSYWMRSSTPDQPCALTIQPNATAIVYYSHPDTPQTTPWPAFIESLSRCQNVSSSMLSLVNANNMTGSSRRFYTMVPNGIRSISCDHRED